MKKTFKSASRRAFIASSASVAGAVIMAGVGRTASAAGPAQAPAHPSTSLGTEHVLTVRANIDPVITMGKTPLGDRRVITISGGTFEGPRMRGIIMPGGEDWQITRGDGVTELDAQYWLRADDGVIIKVQNRALVAPGAGNNGEPYFRCSPRFEAPMGAHDWLNKAIFVGTAAVDNPTQPKVVTLQFYKVT